MLPGTPQAARRVRRPRVCFTPSAAPSNVTRILSPNKHLISPNYNSLHSLNNPNKARRASGVVAAAPASSFLKSTHEMSQTKIWIILLDRALYNRPLFTISNYKLESIALSNIIFVCSFVYRLYHHQGNERAKDGISNPKGPNKNRWRKPRLQRNVKSIILLSTKNLTILIPSLKKNPGLCRRAQLLVPYVLFDDIITS